MATQHYCRYLKERNEQRIRNSRLVPAQMELKRNTDRYGKEHISVYIKRNGKSWVRITDDLENFEKNDEKRYLEKVKNFGIHFNSPNHDNEYWPSSEESMNYNIRSNITNYAKRFSKDPSFSKENGSVNKEVMVHKKALEFINTWHRQAHGGLTVFEKQLKYPIKNRISNSTYNKSEVQERIDKLYKRGDVVNVDLTPAHGVESLKRGIDSIKLARFDDKLVNVSMCGCGCWDEEVKQTGISSEKIKTAFSHDPFIVLKWR